MVLRRRSTVMLWRCPECEWVGYSVDGHCRQFDEHPDGPRIPLESVEYVSIDDLGFNDLMRIAERLLEADYPEDVFPGPFRYAADPGVQLVVALRACLRAVDAKGSA